MNIKNRICDKCKREIRPSNYERHIRVCDGTIKKNIPVDEKWLQSNGKYKCPHCEKEYSKYGISNHIWRNHTEEGKNFDPAIGFKNGTRVGWNKGKTLSKEYKEKISNTLKGRKGTPHTDESKKKLSRAAKRNGLGGHTSKKAIHYMQKDGTSVYLQSDYEVKVAQDLDSNDINWTRPEPLLWVDEQYESHRYYPDFYLTDFNVYLDPKNDYLIKRDKKKIESVEKQNDVKVIVLDVNNLTWNKIKTLL